MTNTIKKIFVTILALFAVFLFGGIFLMDATDKQTVKADEVTEVTIKSITYAGVRSNGVQLRFDIVFEQNVDISEILKNYYGKEYSNEYGSVPFKVNDTDPSQYRVPYDFLYDAAAPSASNAIRLHISANDYSSIESLTFLKGTTIACDTIVISTSSAWVPTTTLSKDTYNSVTNVSFVKTDLNMPEYFKDMTIPTETKGDIVLPAEYNGYPCDWNSSNTGVLTAEGKVTRPGIWQPDVDVVLTVESNGCQCAFTITVLAKRVASVSFDIGDLGDISKNAMIDFTGKYLTVTYDDETTAKVVITQDMLDYDTSEMGEKVGVIQYRGVTTTFTYIVIGEAEVEDSSNSSNSTTDDKAEAVQSSGVAGCNSTVEGCMGMLSMILFGCLLLLREDKRIISKNK